MYFFFAYTTHIYSTHTRVIIIIFSIMWTNRRLRRWRPSGRKWFQRIYDFIYCMLLAVGCTYACLNNTRGLLSRQFIRRISARSDVFLRINNFDEIENALIFVRSSAMYICVCVVHAAFDLQLLYLRLVPLNV